MRRIVLGCCLPECLCGSLGPAGVGAVAPTLSQRAVGVCACCGASSCTRLIVPVFRHPGPNASCIHFLGLLPFPTTCVDMLSVARVFYQVSFPVGEVIERQAISQPLGT